MSVMSLLKPIGAFVSLIRYKVDRIRLNKFISQGLKVGKNVYIMEDAEFDYHYPFLIEIGDNCRISKGVRILAHDATTFRELGVTRIAPVKILEGTFIGERAVILPGVTVGPHALIAAGSIVNRDIGEDKAVAGNPARPYGTYTDLINKYRDIAISSKVFNKQDIESGSVTSNDLLAAIEKHSLAFMRGVPRKDPYYINTDMDQLRKAALKVFDDLIDASNRSDSRLNRSGHERETEKDMD